MARCQMRINDRSMEAFQNKEECNNSCALQPNHFHLYVKDLLVYIAKNTEIASDLEMDGSDFTPVSTAFP